MNGVPSRIDTVVVGAGQAGLTMSWYLRRAGREHVVVERRPTLGGGWQDRWDGFRLVGPNWTASFPEAPYDGEDPDGFMPRDEIAGRIASYATRIGAPVVVEAGVTRLTARAGGGFLVSTAQGPIEAREVVVATGGFHVPHLPPIAGSLPSRVTSLHSHDYRRPDDLPAGAVLVVGSGQTGVQLAEELRAAGREIFLSVGSAGRVPRRYRGRDIFYWLVQLCERGEEFGLALPTADQLPNPARRLAGNPHLSGHGGGHETNLRRIGRNGTVLLGRLVDVEGERVRLAGDLHANLEAADRFFDEKFRDDIDGLIEAAGLDVPPADPPDVVDYQPPLVEELDLAAAGISTVIWAAGYRQDYRWIEPPVTDELGFPRQRRGASEVPGLYFLGSLWLHDQTSATLFGLPRDARVLASRMGLAQG